MGSVPSGVKAAWNAASYAAASSAVSTGLVGLPFRTLERGQRAEVPDALQVGAAVRQAGRFVRRLRSRRERASAGHGEQGQHGHDAANVHLIPPGRRAAVSATKFRSL